MLAPESLVLTTAYANQKARTNLQALGILNDGNAHIIHQRQGCYDHLFWRLCTVACPTVESGDINNIFANNVPAFLQKEDHARLQPCI